MLIKGEKVSGRREGRNEGVWRKLKVHKLGACSVNPIWGRHYFGSGIVAKLTIILASKSSDPPERPSITSDLHPNIILLLQHLNIIRWLSYFELESLHKFISENDFCCVWKNVYFHICKFIFGCWLRDLGMPILNLLLFYD